MPLSKSALSNMWNRRLDLHDQAQEDLVRALNRVIRALAQDYELRQVAAVQGDRKDFESFYSKAVDLETKGEVTNCASCFERIGDIVRARVVCQTLTDVRRMERLIIETQAITPRMIDVKQTDTGYRAVHIDAIINVPDPVEPVGVKCEVQLQTSLQLGWGWFTHKDFYKGGTIPPLVGKLMVELSSLLAVADKVADELILEIHRTRGSGSVPASSPAGAGGSRRPADAQAPS